MWKPISDDERAVDGEPGTPANAIPSRGDAPEAGRNGSGAAKDPELNARISPAAQGRQAGGAEDEKRCGSFGSSRTTTARPAGTGDEEAASSWEMDGGSGT